MMGIHSLISCGGFTADENSDGCTFSFEQSPGKHDVC